MKTNAPQKASVNCRDGRLSLNVCLVAQSLQLKFRRSGTTCGTSFISGQGNSGDVSLRK